MPSEEKITRANAMDLIRRFAKEYRKTLGKSPAEIIIVGGGSIMLNYKFRDATQDFDVILRAASGIKQYRRDGSFCSLTIHEIKMDTGDCPRCPHPQTGGSRL